MLRYGPRLSIRPGAAWIVGPDGSAGEAYRNTQARLGWFEPPGNRRGGIDAGEDYHHVVVVDGEGRRLRSHRWPTTNRTRSGDRHHREAIGDAVQKGGMDVVAVQRSAAAALPGRLAGEVRCWLRGRSRMSSFGGWSIGLGRAPRVCLADLDRDARKARTGCWPAASARTRTPKR